MFFYVKFMFIYVKIKKKILFINIPIEKILVLFSDEEIHEDFQIRGNPRGRELFLAEFLEEFANPRGFPHVFLVRK